MVLTGYWVQHVIFTILCSSQNVKHVKHWLIPRQLALGYYLPYPINVHITYY